MTDTPYRTMPTEALWAAFDAALANISREVVALAAAAHELAERGERVDRRLGATYSLLDRVYTGHLHPDVFTIFLGHIELCRTISVSLVLEEQQKLLARDCLIPVLRRDMAGVERVEMIKPSALTVPQAQQCFGAGVIRSIDEQRKFMPKVVAMPAVTIREPVLRPIAPPSVTIESDEPRTENLILSLSPEEMLLLKRKAREHKTTPIGYVRKLLAFAGVGEKGEVAA